TTCSRSVYESTPSHARGAAVVRRPCLTSSSRTVRKLSPGTTRIERLRSAKFRYEIPPTCACRLQIGPPLIPMFSDEAVTLTHLSRTNSQTASKGPRYVMMPQSPHRFSPPRLETVNASCPATHFSDEMTSTLGSLSRSICHRPMPVL